RGGLGEEGAAPAENLPLLEGPESRPPALHEIAPFLDPFVRGGLLAPQVEHIEVAVWIDANDDVTGVVAAAGRDREIAAAIDVQSLSIGLIVAFQPFGLEQRPLVRDRILLIESAPVGRRGVAADALQRPDWIFLRP